MATSDPGSVTTTWSWPTTVLFGTGTIARLARACEAAGIRRPLVVTDPGLRQLPPLAQALAPLREAGVAFELFSAIQPNPTAANVGEGIEALRAGGHDGVVAIGGGSALDAGKAVAFMAGQTRPLSDFEDIGDHWKRADAAAVLPVVAVPTTAGTGSEVGRAAVITDPAIGRKLIVFHPRMLPATAILDPALTTGLPPHLTAWTGMDALAHCLEAYCAPGFHPMAEGIAVEGLRLMRDALPAAVADGNDLAARGKMLAAAAMGAVAFQKGLGAIHALSHPIGARHDTHHGLTNAVVMPYVLAFNRPAIEARMGRLAAWLGLERPGFAGVMEWILELRRRLDIPHTLALQGVPRERLDELAAMAAVDPTAGGNPVPVGAAELLRLYEDAFAGRLG
jgi:alcohol dehydrogenase class IV